ncbi:MAG: glycosyltransferase family 39 protein, partial [Peptococcaceae bacterium]|nr:glycosyltransferase family 39 protein [Peptococcaceae bacterium]
LEAHNPIESSALNVRPLCVAGFKEQPRVLGYSATTINWYALKRKVNVMKMIPQTERKDGKGSVNKHVDVYLIVLLILFLLLQGAAVFMYGDTYYLGDFDHMNDDDVKYVRSAALLLEESELFYQDMDIRKGVPTVFIMPGFPVFLAVFLKIFGVTGGLLAVRLVQGLLQVGIMLILYRIGKTYFNVWIARLALLLYVLYIPNISVSLMILTETLFTFLFLLLIYVSMEALETKRIRYYVGVGLVLGLAVMIRPTVFVFPLVLVIMCGLMLKVKADQTAEASPGKYTLREVGTRALVVACILVMVLCPWWIRNGLVFGKFIPLTVAAGNPFAQGAVIGYDRSSWTVDILPDLDASHPDTAEIDVESMDAMALDQLDMDLGIRRLQENWQANPVLTIGWYTVGKLIFFWGAPYYNVSNPYFKSPIEQAVFNVSYDGAVFYHWLIFGVALGEMIRMCRKKEKKGDRYWRLKFLLPITITCISVSYLPTFTCPRYAYPLMPLMLVLAASGGYHLYRRVRVHFFLKRSAY